MDYVGIYHASAVGKPSLLGKLREKFEGKKPKLGLVYITFNGTIKLTSSHEEFHRWMKSYDVWDCPFPPEMDADKTRCIEFLKRYRDARMCSGKSGKQGKLPRFTDVELLCRKA